MGIVVPIHHIKMTDKHNFSETVISNINLYRLTNPHLGRDLNSFHEKCLAPGNLISHCWGICDGVTPVIHSPHRFSQLVLGFKSPNPLPLSLSFSPPLFHIYFLVCMKWALWRITLPRCNPIKKSRNWFLIFVRCCISPHLWEHTASIISHLITLSKNGYRTAAVSASRGLTCTLKSNWRLYLYVFV